MTQRHDEGVRDATLAAHGQWVKEGTVRLSVDSQMVQTHAQKKKNNTPDINAIAMRDSFLGILHP